ncbi:MAG: FHA domain-containing protein, partial [Oscillochloris sp.]|nr:FHA domain-containing protein [Oscillochloris sp.]
EPSADLLVITELGMGVVELKHSAGLLHVQGETWLTEHGAVRAGTPNQGYANPRQQVQSYTGKIRELMVTYCTDWWSIPMRTLNKTLRVQSAVCFTKPSLIIPDDAKMAIISAADADYSRLGRFDLLVPPEFPAWVAALRFEVSQGSAARYQPYRLEQHQISQVIEHFQAAEWSAVQALMPSGQAYAYLIIRAEQQEPQIFSLHTLDFQVGRSASNCALTVPRGYGKVSRVHAQFNRYSDDIWLQDLHSSHGTYVNGVRVGQAVILKPGDQITLGGPRPEPGVYTCEFVRRLPDDVLATETVYG